MTRQRGVHPTTSVQDIDGQPTEVIETVSATETSPDLEVVIIPGNPGTGLFYVPYMRYLHAKLHPRNVRIRTVSHLGHSRYLYKPAHYTLEDQVHHKHRYLQLNYSQASTDKGEKEYNLRSGSGTRNRKTGRSASKASADTPLLVIGHSIGGYMAIEAVKRWSAAMESKGSGRSETCKILALMPYMQFDESSAKQRRIERLAQRPYLPASLAGLLSFVPKFLTVRMIRAFDKNLAGESAHHVADQLISYTFSHNALSLGRSEFKSLRKEIEWDWMVGNARRLGFVFCPGDHWAPVKLYDEMTEKLPKSTFLKFREDQFHGFVTQLDSSQRMAELTEDFLSSFKN